MTATAKRNARRLNEARHVFLELLTGKPWHQAPREIDDRVEAAFAAYAATWPEMDPRDWVWPAAQLKEPVPFAPAPDSGEPWTTLLREAVALARG